MLSKDLKSNSFNQLIIVKITENILKLISNLNSFNLWITLSKYSKQNLFQPKKSFLKNSKNDVNHWKLFFKKIVHLFYQLINCRFVLVRFPFARCSAVGFHFRIFLLNFGSIWFLLRPANGSSVRRPHPSQFSVAFALNRPTMGNLFHFLLWNFSLNRKPLESLPIHFQLIYICRCTRSLFLKKKKKISFQIGARTASSLNIHWPLLARTCGPVNNSRLWPNASYAYSLTRVVNMTQVRGWGHGRRWIRRGTWRSGCSGEGLRRSGHGGFGFRWRHWWSILKYFCWRKPIALTRLCPSLSCPSNFIVPIVSLFFYQSVRLVRVLPSLFNFHLFLCWKNCQTVSFSRRSPSVALCFFGCSWPTKFHFAAR